MRSPRILIALFLCASAAEAQWTNEPAGATRVLDFDFSAMSSPNFHFYGGNAAIMSEGGRTFARCNYPAGFKGGDGCAKWYTGVLNGTRSSYTGFWWRPSDPWDGHGSRGNKIVFLGIFGSIVVLEMWGDGPDGQAPYKLNIYSPQPDTVCNGHLTNIQQAASPCGTVHLAPNRSSTKITLGQWHKIEACLSHSTTHTSKDGVIKWWMDGELIGEVTNMNIAGPWQEWQVAPTWGGTGDVKQTSDYFDFDHVVLSKVPSCTGGSTVPPPPPTTPPPPPAASPGRVTDLAAAASGANTVGLSFSQVDDGTGSPAKYIVRASSSSALWGGAPDVSQGTCASPLSGTAASGPLSCTVGGLLPGTRYDFQLIAFRGTMNVDAVFGSLSNVVSATTSSAPNAPADINGDGAITINDVQAAINQSLGLSSCGSADINADGACNITDVQRVVNAVLGL